MEETKVDEETTKVEPLSETKLKSKKEKKKKANKLRKILKERLNIDCLRMLTTQPEIEDGFDDNPAATDNSPVKLELTS